MAKNELEQNAGKMTGRASRAGVKSAGDRGKALPLTLIIASVIFGALLAGGTAFYLYFNRVTPEAAPVIISEPPRPLIASSRAREIHSLRRLMRSEYRSTHNYNLVRERGPEDMLWLTSQAELTLLTGLFEHYMFTTARFFEFMRLLSNDYLNQRWELKDLYEKEILRTFENAERRRKLLHRRIEHDPALELFGHLDYIAYYDSIAVYSFYNYLNAGDKGEFNVAVEQVNTAKFMIKDFWNYFKVHLVHYRVDFEPKGDVWKRYFQPG